MAIDTTTPEGRNRELRNIALLQAKRELQRAMDEVQYLIMATPTGDRRNTFTDANIHMTSAQTFLNTLSSEES